MTKTFTLFAGAAMAIALSACATSTDDKYSVGVDDNDNMTSTQDGSDISLPDSQTFGIDDNDKFEAETETQTVKTEAAMPMVGGAAMSPTKTIVENASAASNLTTLVSAVKQAELVETLSGDGPFTVFAPTNTAFQTVPAATLSALMTDGKKADLQKVLTGHVVAGVKTAEDLKVDVLFGNGAHTLTTVSGDTLNVFVSGDAVKIADERGYVATVTTADVMQSNGVVHIIDSVLIGE